MPSSPDQPPSPAPEQPRRSFRPTILDALIFTAAAAAGLALARTGTLASQGDLYLWGAYLCLAWIITATLSGPAIVGGQYLRGRRGRLGVGEVLWLLPASLYLFAAFTGWLGIEVLAGRSAIAALATHGLCACAAFFYLPLANEFRREFRPAWTDWMGAALCLTTWVAIGFQVHFFI